MIPWALFNALTDKCIITASSKEKARLCKDRLCSIQYQLIALHSLLNINFQKGILICRLGSIMMWSMDKDLQIMK